MHTIENQAEAETGTSANQRVWSLIDAIENGEAPLEVVVLPLINGDQLKIYKQLVDRFPEYAFKLKYETVRKAIHSRSTKMWYAGDLWDLVRKRAVQNLRNSIEETAPSAAMSV